MKTKTCKCFHCHSKVSPRLLPYFWVVYRGQERPHCSAFCKAQTEAKKEKSKA